jgi:magnesium transporter
MSNDQNEEVKKISAWAAILFAPTLVGTVYGMNFDNTPELTWDLGYPPALALMVFLGVALYVLFKRRNGSEHETARSRRRAQIAHSFSSEQ